MGVQGTASQAGQGWGIGAVSGAASGANVAAIGWGAGYPANANDALVLPPIDLTQATAPVLVFQQVYDIEDYYDGAKVIVWDGTDWTFPDPQGGYPVAQLYYQTPADGWYTGLQGSWQTQVFDLSAYKGLNDVVIGFWFVSDQDDTSMPSGWGGFWALDDVKVGEASVLGASVSGGSGTTGTTTGTSTTTSTSTGTTASGNVLFAEDFEGSQVNMGAVSAAGTDEWYVEDPSYYTTPGLPSAAAQGSYVAGTKFVDVYDDYAEDLLFTPEIDFSGKSTGTLTFKAFFDLETYGSGAYAADGVRLLATPDWVDWYLVSPTPDYPYQECDAFTDSQGNSSPVWGGASGGWKSYSVDVSGALSYSTKWTFAWEFASDFSIGKAGFFLDDIKVTAQ